MKTLSNPRSLLSLLSLLSLFSPPTQAEDGPYRLADTNPGRQDPTFLSDVAATPAGFFQIGNRLLFSTVNRNSADEGMLWSTDGTPGGTAVVSSSLCPTPCQRVTALGSWHGFTFLEAVSGVGPLSGSLWRTDGTAGGTIFLSGPFEHPLDSPYVLELHADPEAAAAFFTTGCDPRGCRLWRSDGTPAGTGLVRHPDSRPFDNPRDLTFWRGRLYFLADHTDPNGLVSSGLWSTDGTPAGTFFVADEHKGDYPPLVVPTPSHLFFTSGPNGEDLWVSGGGPGDARLLHDFPPPPCPPQPEQDCDPPFVETLAAFGDAVYFEARRDGHGGGIWRSDGTEAGTGPVLEVPGDTVLQDLHPLGGRWIFSVGSPSGAPAALWTADAGFTQASPLAGCPEGCPSFIGSIDFLANGSWLFAGTGAARGIEPWVTDGTGPGTRRLADACPGTCDGIRLQGDFYSTSLGTRDGRTWFHAYSSADEATIDGDELWVTDGTPGGTRRVTGHVNGIGFLGGLAFYGVANTRRSTSDLWAADASGASHRVAVLRRFGAGADSLYKPFRNGALLLVQREALTSELWKSDGTPAGTAPLYGFEPGSGRSFSSFLGALGPLELLAVSHQEGPPSAPRSLAEIWRTDGTSRHTQKVFGFPGGVLFGLPVPWRGNLLLDVFDGPLNSFWVTDGTAAGTREILPLPANVNPTAVTAFGSRFLFVAQVQTGKRSFPQLFISDGTPAGTRQISAIHQPRDILFDDRPVQVGGTVFFRLNDPSFDRTPELWRTDGTLEGTRRVSPLTGVDDVYVFRGALYFTADLPDSEDGSRGLFRMALPGGSPVQIATEGISSQVFPLGYPAARFTPLGDRLLFVGTDRQGIEPWITDGTPEGTHPLLDIQPGAGSSNPASLVSAGSRAFFSADDGTHGRELWETDGTPEGTRMVADIAPGGLSALPYYYFPGNTTVSNGFLFFNADDGTTGPEPWALRLEP